MRDGLVGAWLWLGALPLAVAGGTGLPDPLDLPSALRWGAEHPRNQLPAETAQRIPARPPLYLDCHGLAFGDPGSQNPQRSADRGLWLSPQGDRQLEILERFFDVLLADLGFSRDSEAMAVAYIQLDRAKARRELGQYSDLRVAELEATYQDIRQRRTASETAQRLTRARLALGLGQKELPRDLQPPALPSFPSDLPEAERLAASAAANNYWYRARANTNGEAERQWLSLALHQEVLERLLRLQALEALAQSAHAETRRRDLNLEESQVLYEREYRADLGFSMSQQTKARIEEQQVAYCQALAWAELNLLQGRAAWPPVGD